LIHHNTGAISWKITFPWGERKNSQCYLGENILKGEEKEGE
jgi:hypothetical protein